MLQAYDKLMQPVVEYSVGACITLRLAHRANDKASMQVCLQTWANGFGFGLQLPFSFLDLQPCPGHSSWDPRLKYHNNHHNVSWPCIICITLYSAVCAQHPKKHCPVTSDLHYLQFIHNMMMLPGTEVLSKWLAWHCHKCSFASVHNTHDTVILAASGLPTTAASRQQILIC